MDKVKTFDERKCNTSCLRFYIEGYLLDILKSFCKEEEMTMSETINAALDGYFLKQGCNKYFYK